MKKINLLVVFFVSFIILSCSNDDNNQNVNVGEMIVNGQSYSLTKGFIIPNYTGNDPNYSSRRFYFVLTNGDISLVNNEFVYSDNITQLIDFNMFTSFENSGSLEETTYPIYLTNPNVNNDDAFLDHSSINTNVVIQNNEYVSSNSISSDNLIGQVTISKNNGIYTITFSFNNDDNVISGTFIGNLTELEYEH